MEPSHNDILATSLVALASHDILCRYSLPTAWRYDKSAARWLVKGNLGHCQCGPSALYSIDAVQVEPATTIASDDEHLGLYRGEFTTPDGAAPVSHPGTLPRGYIGLALSRADATALMQAIDFADDEAPITDDERRRLAGIRAALLVETT
jgi:hypothetical protein